MKKITPTLLFCLLTVFVCLGAIPNDPMVNWDTNRRLPLSSNPSTYFRDEYCWYFNNQLINTHVYNSQGVIQSQFDEPVGNSDISALEAWDILHETTNITVAVIDNGFDITHEDLTNNIYLPGIFFDGLGGTNSDISDLTGHGTMVLSVLAANGNNNIGMCGVLWRSKILPIKIDTRGAIRWADAINYAIDNKARVINISAVTTSDENTRLALLRASYSNIVVVCSAPNSYVNLDVTLDYPTSWYLPNVISVSNNRRDEVMYPYSAYGTNSVDLFAPGRLIVAAWPGNQYRYTSGTSFSSAFVTGSIALITEKYPYLNYLQVINKLLINVDKYSSYTDKCISGGRLNLYKPLVDIRLQMTYQGLLIYGASGQTVQIESSSDLVNWSIYSVFTITNSPMVLSDVFTSGYMFFRGKQIDSPNPTTFLLNKGTEYNKIDKQYKKKIKP